MKNVRKNTFTNVIWQEGKFYVAQCLNVDVSSFGKTKKEALKNLQEALALYLEDAPKGSIKAISNPSLATSDLSHFQHA